MKLQAYVFNSMIACIAAIPIGYLIAAFILNRENWNQPLGISLRIIIAGVLINGIVSWLIAVFHYATGKWKKY